MTLACFLTLIHSTAPRILLGALSAEIIEPNSAGCAGFPNIVAFQITQDLRKYIQNVFNLLVLPWTHIPSEYIGNIRDLISKFYSAKNVEIFDMDVNVNQKIIEVDYFGHSSIPQGTIFYEAGNDMRHIISMFSFIENTFNYPIWDINAKNIHDIAEHLVTLPDFVTPAQPNSAVIITIEDAKIAQEVCLKLEVLGFTVFHGISEFNT